MDHSDRDLMSALRRAAPFRELADSVLDRLAAAASWREVAPGEVVFREDDPGDSLFVVAEGLLEVSRRNPSGVDVPLRRLGPGDVGGTTSMTVAKTRSATLRALGASRLVTVDREAFRSALDEEPELARSLIAFLAAKVREKTGRMAALQTRAGDPGRVPVAVFDAKPYDRRSLECHRGDDLELRFLEPRLSPATAGLAAGHPVVCAFVNDDLSAPVLERLAGDGVGLVAMRCAGYNNVDLAAAARLELSVVRVPAYSPHAVAEHAVALLLTLNRKVHRAFNRVREGNFSLVGLEGFDLHGRTAGIVGFGTIGRCLAEILRGFGMRVLAYDAYPEPAAAAELGVELTSLDDLVERSDVVSLHAPLTPDTFHMFDAERFSRLKPGAMLLNTGRGALVDTAAMIESLKSGRLGAAGLDVYEEESGYFFEDLSDRVITDDVLARLMTFPNVVITSHQGFLTRDALDAIAETTAGSIREFLLGARGDELTNAVTAGG